LYWKPVAAVPVQKARPEALVPCARENVCRLPVPPSAVTSRTAPPLGVRSVGSPTTVFPLADSLATPVTLRLSFAPVGFFTAKLRPSTVCSAARAAPPPNDITDTITNTAATFGILPPLALRRDTFAAPP
jgi:hypothetical protein